MSTTAAQVRGCAAGAFTAALAVAAHGVGSGDMALPAGASILLVVLAAVVGVFTGHCSRTAHTAPLLAVLAAGQLLGHVGLSLGAHHHGGSAAMMPSAAMTAAHLAAVALGAGLIRLCEHFFAALSRVVTRRPCRDTALPAIARPVPPPRADQPWRRLLLVGTSISHRGPPGAVVS